MTITVKQLRDELAKYPDEMFVFSTDFDESDGEGSVELTRCEVVNENIYKDGSLVPPWVKSRKEYLKEVLRIS